jgi:uncharacterized protein YbaR (Trm112 family)
MTDKVQKIREEVEKRYEYWKEKESNSHSIESEIRMSECQHLLLMLNSLQEEHVSDDFEMALTEMIDKAQKCVVEPIVVAQQWKDYLVELAKSEEPVSEIDFEQELYKYFGQVKDFTLGMRIAKHFFELGLRSTITEEDCKLIWNIGDEIPCMTEEEFFKELLRRYKAHKGEEV